VTIDDGKANVVGHQFLDDFNAALDEAEQQAKALLITGRPGLLSAGFDLKEFEKGDEQRLTLVKRGFAMLYRLYGFPMPTVIACTGHAIALGAFMLLASDSRLGVEGEFKISLPETAIGMELTPLLMALVQDRISKRHITRAAIQSENYSPLTAIDAGFLDQLQSPGELMDAALEEAGRLAALPREFYTRNKLAARRNALLQMANSLETG
jgi:enoyl-CoA hydratase